MTFFDLQGLSPLEIWNGLTPQGPLHFNSGHSLGLALEYFLLSLHAGKAQTERSSDADRLRQAAGFDRLTLVGGRSAEIHHHLGHKDLPFEVVALIESPEVRNRRLSLTGANFILDWGQTSLKLTQDSGVQEFARDLRLFPFAEEKRIPSPEAKARIQSYFRSVLGAIPKQGRLALALPVEILDGVAGPCTYQGLEGSVSEIFRDTTRDFDVTVMNDAILGALGVIPEKKKELVVTCGFGFGGALWHR
jgi:hypothetical protein